MAVAKYWFEQYGAIPAAMSHDELEFLLPTPVSREKAMKVAAEQYGFCPDIVDQEQDDPTVGNLAMSCGSPRCGTSGGIDGRCDHERIPEAIY